MEAPLNVPMADAAGLPAWAWGVFFTELSRRGNAPAAAPVVTAAASTSAIVGTHDDRLALRAETLAEGSLFLERDRDLMYQVRGKAWWWVGGTYRRTQAQLSALAATLSAYDAGLLAEVTDYAHVLRWTGTAWEWGPGDTQGTQIQACWVDPSPTTGWKLLDGTGDDGQPHGAAHPIAYLKSDGTTGSVTNLPNVSGAGQSGYLKLSPTSGGPNNATAPTTTLDSYTPTGTIAAANFNSNQAASVAGMTVLTGPAAHDHVFTGDAATPTGTVSDTGEPRNITVRAWFRR